MAGRRLTGHDVVDLAKKFEDYGVEAIIYTDIGRDGMLSGVNIEAHRAARARAQDTGDRQRRHHQHRRHPGARRVESEGISGAIAGRALYEGTLDFIAALKAAKG